MTKIKICGLSTPEMIDVAVGAGADYVGFVFFAKSPRHLDVAQAAELAGRVPAHVRRVGVFVDPDDAYLAEATRAARLDIVQLHAVDPRRVAGVRAQFGRPVWMATSVATGRDIDAAVAARGAADCLLFDAKPPNEAELPGGNGVRFDWRLLAGRNPGGHWGLAGGLDPDSVADAIAVTSAPLVDVSSGVEDAPGQKSAMKIRAFCEAVRQR